MIIQLHNYKYVYPYFSETQYFFTYTEKHGRYPSTCVVEWREAIGHHNGVDDTPHTVHHGDL